MENVSDKNEIKQLNNVVTPAIHKRFNYAKDCSSWVQFKSGRKKMKLRKYIRTMAMSINRINGRGDEVNRKNLILNYDNYGFEGVRLYLNEEIKVMEQIVTN